MSLMPSVRVGRKGWPPLKKVPNDPLEWDGLRKGSKQGLVLLLVGLSWWVAKAMKKKDKEMVSAVLVDVLFVMRQLAVSASDNDKSVLQKRTRCAEPRRVSLKRYLRKCS